MRNRFLSTAAYYNKPDDVGGGAATPAVVVETPVAAVGEPATLSESGASQDAPAPVVVETPAADAPVEGAAPADAGPRKSLLSEAVAEGEKPADAPAKDDQKPADAPKEGDKPAESDKKPDDVPAAEVVAAPVYEFKFADGITVAPEQLKPFTDILGESKISPEVGQKLIDMYQANMQQYATHVASENARIWDETRTGWRDEVLADKQIGGAGHKTSMMAIARMRDKLVPEADKPAFTHMLDTTGVGDHPQFLKMLHTVSKFLDEPATPKIQGQPAGSNGRKPGRGGLKQIYKQTR